VGRMSSWSRMASLHSLLPWLLFFAPPSQVPPGVRVRPSSWTRFGRGWSAPRWPVPYGRWWMWLSAHSRRRTIVVAEEGRVPPPAVPLAHVLADRSQWPVCGVAVVWLALSYDRTRKLFALDNRAGTLWPCAGRSTRASCATLRPPAIARSFHIWHCGVDPIVGADARRGARTRNAYDDPERRCRSGNPRRGAGSRPPGPDSKRQSSDAAEFVCRAISAFAAHYRSGRQERPAPSPISTIISRQGRPVPGHSSSAR